MIRCAVCSLPLRIRAGTGAWVHVDDAGNALASESLWPRDHAPKAVRTRASKYDADGSADIARRVREVLAPANVQIRWGDGLAWDSAHWDRLWVKRIV